MKRCTIVFGIAVIIFGLLPSIVGASPLELLFDEEGVRINLGNYFEFEGESYNDFGDIPNFGAGRSRDCRMYSESVITESVHGLYQLNTFWELGYYLTEKGFSIYSDVTMTVSYGYFPGLEGNNPGYAYAFSGSEGGNIWDCLKITPTPQNPAGSKIAFTIHTETSGTPWEKLEWVFKLDGITVNQSNYDQVVFDLVVGELYHFTFDIPESSGFQTQSIVEGSLESYFDWHFVTVPIPGAIWLLGSGLAGLIGLRKKYLH